MRLLRSCLVLLARVIAQTLGSLGALGGSVLLLSVSIDAALWPLSIWRGASRAIDLLVSLLFRGLVGRDLRPTLHLRIPYLVLIISHLLLF